MRVLLSIGEVARSMGVCVNTVRNWDKTGRLKPSVRTPDGYRRYDACAINKTFYDKAPDGLTVAYARVSSHDQKSDLERQSLRLRKEYLDRDFRNVEVIEDLGSGLNFAKRGLRRLLGLVLRRQISRLVVIHKDRLLRFGAELVFEICRVLGVEVVITEQDLTDVMSTLAADVIELMTVFSARMYGARSHKSRKALCC